MQVDEFDSGRITLQLLDSAQGHPVQTWHFERQKQVTIGRSGDCDITLADSRVSRLHVELKHEAGKWFLHSHGRNGTQVNGDDVAQTRLRDGAIFQLGANGPSFKFVTVSEEDSTMATIDNIDPMGFDFLEIDEQRKAEEVKQIAETDAFKELQERARRLRNGGNMFETEF